MADTRVHVVPSGDHWGVKHEGDEDPVETFDSRDEAIDYAHVLADDAQAGIMIHDRRGRFGASIPPEDVGPSRHTAATPRRDGRRPPDDRSVIEPSAERSVRHRVSWSALSVGLVTGFATTAGVGMFSLALLATWWATAEPTDLRWATGTLSATSVAVGLFVGGFVASRATGGETKGEAALYSVTVWGLWMIVLPVVAASIPVLDTTSLGAALQNPDLQRLGEPGFATAVWSAFGGVCLYLAIAVLGAVAGAGPSPAGRPSPRTDRG